jgi:hypothetical protein
VSEVLSDERLAEIESRCAAATTGSWVICRESDEWGTIGMPVCRMEDDTDLVVGHPHDWGATAPVADDAAFIAHARRDVPELLAEVRRLRAVERELRGHVRALVARVESLVDRGAEGR